MEMNNWLAALIVVLMLCAGIFVGGLGFSKTVEVEKTIIQEKLVDKECPVCTCPEIVIPKVENADNVLLNEFLENEFAGNYTAIEDAAEIFVLEELEDDDYEVIVDYLNSIVEGVDEDSIDVDIEDTDIQVTMLGLEEDEDKSARVTFEIEVEYELEEGVREAFEIDLVVIYDVVFDEGDLTDEDVELVLIV